MKDGINIIVRETFMGGFDLLIREGESFATQITMERLEPGTIPRNAGLIIDREAATQLMEQLWNYGIRPADTRYKSDAVNAMKEHIADLRKITFKILKMEG